LLRELSRIGFTDGELRFADDEACAVSGRKPGNIIVTVAEARPMKPIDRGPSGLEQRGES